MAAKSTVPEPTKYDPNFHKLKPSTRSHMISKSSLSRYNCTKKEPATMRKDGSTGALPSPSSYHPDSFFLFSKKTKGNFKFKSDKRTSFIDVSIKRSFGPGAGTYQKVEEAHLKLSRSPSPRKRN
jgi:hypothetical protein